MLVQFFTSHCSYSAVHSEFCQCTSVNLKFPQKNCSIPVWACLKMQYLKPDENEQVACHTFWSVGRLVTPTRFEWEGLSHLWPVCVGFAHNTCSLLLEGISISALGWKGGIIKFVVDSYICNHKIWFLSRWFLMLCMCTVGVLLFKNFMNKTIN